MHLRKIPEPETAFRVAVVMALLPASGMCADASGVEAYQVDRWMSYEVQECASDLSWTST